MIVVSGQQTHTLHIDLLRNAALCPNNPGISESRQEGTSGLEHIQDIPATEDDHQRHALLHDRLH